MEEGEKVMKAWRKRTRAQSGRPMPPYKSERGSREPVQVSKDVGRRVLTNFTLLFIKKAWDASEGDCLVKLASRSCEVLKNLCRMGVCTHADLSLQASTVPRATHADD